MRLRVIVNPNAGAGKAGKRGLEISAALGRLGLVHDLRHTRAPGDATRLAVEARDDGVELIAVVGGDGTLNEVAQAYLSASGSEAIAGPELCVVPAGTGGDFRRSFDLADSTEAGLERLCGARARAVDLGYVSVTTGSGATVPRAFLNIASFGISGEISALANKSGKWLGGAATFFLSTIKATMLYENVGVEILVDNKPWFAGSVYTVALANGSFFGGGMRVAPLADACDGLLDVVCLGDLSKLEALQLSQKIYSGSHLAHAKICSTRGSYIEARPQREGDVILVDVDGETPGRLPLVAGVLPAALRIRI